MASLRHLARALALPFLLAALASGAHADTTRCRKDSGGNTICRSERCSTVCRRDSGGNLVCRETCR